MFVDADNVVHAAAVAGNRDHRGERPARLGRQQVTKHPDAGPALKDELLPGVRGILADLQRLGVERRPLAGEATHQFDDFSAQATLPSLGLGKGGSAESHPQRGRVMQLHGEEHGVEARRVHFAFKTVESAGILGRPVLGGKLVQRHRARHGELA